MTFALAAGRTIFSYRRTASSLVRSFLDGLTAREEAVVLFGRCYERESVPYKALDSLIDALARHLKGLRNRKVTSLLPPDVAYLARVRPSDVNPAAADDAAEVGWHRLDRLPPLAFDHDQILACARRRLAPTRAKKPPARRVRPRGAVRGR